MSGVLFTANLYQNAITYRQLSICIRVEILRNFADAVRYFEKVDVIRCSETAYCCLAFVLCITHSGYGVTSIGNYAFYGCSGLTSATFENTSGWQVAPSSISSSYTSLSSRNLSNPSTAATYLKLSYDYYYWRRV